MLKIEILKIKLLADSQNMLVAAQQGDWERLSQLDLLWQEQVKQGLSLYKNDLESIIPQLLLDNDKIQSCLLDEQQAILGKHQSELKLFNQVKSYLAQVPT